MTMYLKIENIGIADPASFTLLGASSKSSSSSYIGCFGSGTKYSIALALRHNLAPVIYSGSLKMEFGTQGTKVNGVIFHQITVKYGGKDIEGKNKSSTETLGFVKSYGSADWKDICLGLREFVSNAIDGAKAYGEVDYMKYVTVEPVTEDKVRAKAGYTRVFIPMNDQVFAFYNDLGKWFLHFSEPEFLNKEILPKNNRNLGESRTAVIYKKGVRVREIINEQTPSLFDYNLSGLPLDESRKVDDYSVKHYAAYYLAKAEESVLSQLFEGIIDRRNLWETTFSSYSLECAISSEEKVKWNKAFEKVAGETGVACTKDGGEIAARKGYSVVEMPEEFMGAVRLAGLRTPSTLFDKNELEGRTIRNATSQAQKAVDFAWGIIEMCDYTNGKPKPPVKSFSQTQKGDGILFGYYLDGVVYMNVDYAGDADIPVESLTTQVISTAIEECLHYSTGCLDFSRSLQSTLFDMIVKLVR